MANQAAREMSKANGRAPAPVEEVDGEAVGVLVPSEPGPDLQGNINDLKEILRLAMQQRDVHATRANNLEIDLIRANQKVEYLTRLLQLIPEETVGIARERLVESGTPS